MKNFKNTLIYIAILGAFFTIIYWVLHFGETLENGRNIVEII